jgi:hypothetical protein
MSEAVMGGHEAFAERQVSGGRLMSQGLLGIAVIILGIVGLAIESSHPHVPIYLDAIAAIILGLSLVFAGAGFTVAYGRLATRVEGSAAGAMPGLSAGMFLGSAVVVLGILGVLGVATAVLVPVAVIVVGTGLIMSSGTSIRLALLESELAPERTVARRVGEEMTFTSESMRAIAGIAVIILGILGLGGADALVLTLAAMIVAGAGLLSSTSMNSRMVSAFVPRRM